MRNSSQTVQHIFVPKRKSLYKRASIIRALQRRKTISLFREESYLLKGQAFKEGMRLLKKDIRFNRNCLEDHVSVYLFLRRRNILNQKMKQIIRETSWLDQKPFFLRMHYILHTFIYYHCVAWFQCYRCRNVFLHCIFQPLGRWPPLTLTFIIWEHEPKFCLANAPDHIMKLKNLASYIGVNRSIAAVLVWIENAFKWTPKLEQRNSNFGKPLYTNKTLYKYADNNGCFHIQVMKGKHQNMVAGKQEGEWKRFHYLPCETIAIAATRQKFGALRFNSN